MVLIKAHVIKIMTLDDEVGYFILTKTVKYLLFQILIIMTTLIYEQHPTHPPVATNWEASQPWYIESHRFFQRPGRRTVEPDDDGDSDDDDDDSDGHGDDHIERPTDMGEGQWAHSHADQLPPGYPHQYFDTYWRRISTCETDVVWLKSENDARKAENDARKAENESIMMKMAEMEAAFQKMQVYM